MQVGFIPSSDVSRVPEATRMEFSSLEERGAKGSGIILL